MAHVQVHDSDLDLQSPVLVEGFPGVGLVGKLATDHLVDSFEMDHYASCFCEGIPDIAVYHEGEATVEPPVRIYADADRDLLALQSEVPVSPQDATGFAECLTNWVDEQGALPLYLSGLPTEKDGRPALHGIATGDAGSALETHGIDAPQHSGIVSGPTGALIHGAYRAGIDSVGLVVQSNPQFPDPEAARVLLADAIGPIADVEVETDTLVEQAEEIADARQQLAERMSQGDEEATQAQPLGMFQ